MLNKNGHFVDWISERKAHFSVRSDKSLWIGPHTIQILYHYQDEKEFKYEVWERDEYTCYICDQKMHKGHPELTVDHVIPKRLGGSILPKNMACCCRSCNGQKGHRTYEAYFWNLYAGLLFMILWSRRNKGGNLSGDQDKEKVKT